MFCQLISTTPFCQKRIKNNPYPHLFQGKTNIRLKKKIKFLLSMRLLRDSLLYNGDVLPKKKLILFAGSL